MTSWVDATGFIDQTCAELGPEELVHGENFSLYEAMLAIEIGDSRMDIGMKRGETPPAEVLLAQGRAPVDLEPAQMEALAMQLLQAETTWHQGALLPATVFSSLYMLDLDRCVGGLVGGWAGLTSGKRLEALASVTVTWAA